MTKILLINGHPNPEASTAGKAIVDSLMKRRPDVTVHELKAAFGKYGFDAVAEQEALRVADVIVWHFPFYWYSVPALMKTWMDTVLTRGFAFGTGGTALHGKKLVLSFTTGAPAEKYVRGGGMGWPVKDFLPPLMQTARLCGMEMLTPIWTCGAMYIPDVSTEDDLRRIREAADSHAERLLAEIESTEKNV